MAQRKKPSRSSPRTKQSPRGNAGARRKDPRGAQGVAARGERARRPRARPPGPASRAPEYGSAESALRDREQKLRLVTDAMPMLISYCDHDMVYRFCNAKYTEWFGLAQDEIVGKTVPEVIGEEAFARVGPAIRRALSGERVSYEGKLRYHHGPPREIRVDYVPHITPDGVVAGYYAMIEDISQRAQHDRDRAQLAAIVEYSNDAIIGRDLQGMVTSWNAAAERLYGYTAEEMIGQPLTKIVPPGREDEVAEIIDRLRRGERIEHFETIRRNRAGRDLHVSLTASPVRGSSGELVGISTIVQDISERQERVRALHESERRLKLAQDAAELGIYDYDLQTGQMDWDQSTRSLWSMPEEEFVTLESFFAALHPHDRRALLASIQHAQDPHHEKHFRVECRLQSTGADQGERWVEVTGVAIFDGRTANRIVGTVRDVTERRGFLEQLERADRRKDQFLATLGHELRNPLSALVNTVEYMRSGAEPEELDELCARMSRQTKHMTALLNDLLDVGRITRGDIALRPARVRLASLIARAVEMVRPEIDASGHRLETDIDPADLELVVDPVRIEQVLGNLLANAIHYTPAPGTLTVRGRRLGDCAEIVVQDTGLGLDESDRKRIFDLFYQVRRGSGGMGIGLSLVQSLVTMHGGTIEVHSDGPGEGSTFRVVLPIEAPGGSPRKPQPKPPRGACADLSGLKVLVVDDHEDSLIVLHQMLAKHCEVRSAATGAAALAVLERFKPDVLLLDLALPDMTGIELAAAARAVPGLENAITVAMTGFGDAKILEQLSQAGFRRHLIKPIGIRKLLGVLGDLMVER